jgi:hypothetical protein
MNIFKIFLISISFISSLSAFTFDKWKSGDSFKKVLYTAQNNDIPIAKDGLHHGAKHFNWNLLKDKEKYRTFYYYDNIFGERAKVLLSFTDKSNELYKINIYWNLAGKGNITEFKETLFSILDKKYNKGKKAIETDLAKNIFYKYRVWNHNKRTVIHARTSSHSLDITYLDKATQQVDLQTKEKKKLNIIVKDAGKF